MKIYDELRLCVIERTNEMKKMINKRPGLKLDFSFHSDPPPSCDYRVARHERPGSPATTARGFNPQVYFLCQREQIIILHVLREDEHPTRMGITLNGDNAYSIDRADQEHTAREITRKILDPLLPSS